MCLLFIVTTLLSWILKTNDFKLADFLLSCLSEGNLGLSCFFFLIIFKKGSRAVLLPLRSHRRGGEEGEVLDPLEATSSGSL